MDNREARNAGRESPAFSAYLDLQQRWHAFVRAVGAPGSTGVLDPRAVKAGLELKKKLDTYLLSATAGDIRVADDETGDKKT